MCYLFVFFVSVSGFALSGLFVFFVFAGFPVIARGGVNVRVMCNLLYLPPPLRGTKCRGNPFWKAAQPPPFFWIAASGADAPSSRWREKRGERLYYPSDRTQLLPSLRGTQCRGNPVCFLFWALLLVILLCLSFLCHFYSVIARSAVGTTRQSSLTVRQGTTVLRHCEPLAAWQSTNYIVVHVITAFFLETLGF